MSASDIPPISAPKTIVFRRRGARLVRWLASETFVWALSLLYCSALLTFVGRNLPLVTGAAFPWAASLLIAAATLGLFGVDWWWHWYASSLPSWRTAFALLVARVGLIEIVGLIDPGDAAYFLYLTIPFTAAISMGNRAGLVVGVLLWARLGLLLMAAPAEYPPAQMMQALVMTPVGIVFVLAMARLILAERSARLGTEQLFADLEASNAQLTQYAAQVEELTLTAERNRLAREIHDSLGHYLTTINVLLRKASAFREKDPAQATQAIEDATRLSHTALDDVRRSVGMLRASAPALVFEQALRDLVAPLQSARPAVELTIAGSTAGYAPATLMALYRAAQEGLTNVQRHARASRAQLAVQLGTAEANVTLRDDGVGFAIALLDELPQGRSGRYGLQGIRERLLLVGGVAQITSAPQHGTTLTLTAPKIGPAHLRQSTSDSFATKVEKRGHEVEQGAL